MTGLTLQQCGECNAKRQRRKRETDLEIKILLPALQVLHLKPGSEVLAVPQRSKCAGHHDQSNEPQKRITPAQAEDVVQPNPHQREDGAGNGSNDGIGGQGARCVH